MRRVLNFLAHFTVSKTSSSPPHSTTTSSSIAHSTSCKVSTNDVSWKASHCWAELICAPPSTAHSATVSWSRVASAMAVRTISAPLASSSGKLVMQPNAGQRLASVRPLSSSNSTRSNKTTWTKSDSSVTTRSACISWRMMSYSWVLTSSTTATSWISSARDAAHAFTSKSRFGTSRSIARTQSASVPGVSESSVSPSSWLIGVSVASAVLSKLSTIRGPRLPWIQPSTSQSSLCLSLISGQTRSSVPAVIPLAARLETSKEALTLQRSPPTTQLDKMKALSSRLP